MTWKVYQEKDNFDDNGLAWFKSFQQAKRDSDLYVNGMSFSPDLVEDLAADMKAGRLPQVSWIVAPTGLSEHATGHPAAGEVNFYLPINLNLNL